MTAVKGFGRLWREMDFSDKHHCIWYDPAPNSYTEQYDPCVGLILGIPMSRGEQLPEI